MSEVDNHKELLAAEVLITAVLLLSLVALILMMKKGMTMETTMMMMMRMPMLSMIRAHASLVEAEQNTGLKVKSSRMSV